MKKYFWLFMVLAFVTGPLQAATDPLGVPLVPGSKKIETGRYQTSRDFAKTRKFFKDYFKKTSHRLRWHRIVSLPNVKYMYIQNVSPTRKWDGINIYAEPGQRAYFNILPKAEPAKTSEQ